MRLILGQLDLEPSRGIANFGVVKEQVLSAAPSIDPNDVVVLPELAGGECHADAYEVAVSRLACELGCHVVGGSHYPPRGDRRVNRGAIADPRGTVTSRYEKQNPYGVEHEHRHKRYNETGV